MGDLSILEFAGDHDHATPDQFDERRVVGSIRPGGVCRPQPIGAKHLRRLHGDQRCPSRRCRDDARGIDDLDRVSDRKAGDGTICSGQHRRNRRVIELGAGERSCRVVHTNDVGIIWHGSQSSTHALTSGVTPGHPVFDVGIRNRDDDHDAIGNRLGNPPRSIDHSLVAERLVLLRSTKALARTATDHDRPHLWWGIHLVKGSTVPVWMTDQIDRLSRTSFFADAPTLLLDRVATAGRDRQLVRGDVLFNEGDPPDALYLVGRGRIAIVMSSPVDKRESVVALMEPGDLFGELGLLDDGPRSGMARALEASEVLEIPYEPVRQLFEEDPRLLWNVTRLLAGRLRVMDEVLADSVFLDVTGRTAKRLLELAAGADEFQLPVTQEELAGMVGASRERVNKAISSFIRLGWLEQQDRTYQIIHRDRLELRAR